MKTKKFLSVITVTIVIASCMFLHLGACNGTRENSGENRNEPVETKPEGNPPETDIHTAAFMGNLSAVEQHIRAGTNLDKKDQYGSTPLMIATTFGRTEVAKVLISSGADLNITNNDGATALHSAAFLCRKEIVQALLDHGADNTIKNNFGSTPLESVLAPFEEVKPVYDRFSKDLGPLGLKLDYDHLRECRPQIANMLRSNQ